MTSHMIIRLADLLRRFQVLWFGKFCGTITAGTRDDVLSGPSSSNFVNIWTHTCEVSYG